MEGAPFTKEETRFGHIPTDPYEALGVTPNFTKDQIKSRYRMLLRRYHSDINPNNKEAEIWAKAINEAYDFITNDDVSKGSEFDQREYYRKGAFFKNFRIPMGGAYRRNVNADEDILKQRQERAERLKREADERKREREEAEADLEREREERTRKENEERTNAEQAGATSETSEKTTGTDEGANDANAQANAQNETGTDNNSSDTSEKNINNDEQGPIENNTGTTEEDKEEPAEEEPTSEASGGDNSTPAEEKVNSDEQEPTGNNAGTEEAKEEPAQEPPSEADSGNGSAETAEEDLNNDQQGPTEENAGGAEANEEEAPQEEPQSEPNPEAEAQEIEAELSEARSQYATRLIEWKNKNRESKSWARKHVLDPLGLDKQMPLVPKSQEFLDAEKAYLDAKKRKSQKFFNDTEPILRVDKESGMFGGVRWINKNLIEQAEKEYSSLQQKILESVPPLEKGIINKTFEKWAKLPTPVRIALSTSLMTGIAFAFGGVAASGAAAYAGYRAARSFGSAIASQGVGRKMQSGYNAENKQSHSKTLEAYASGINLENFAQKEKELTEAFEREKNTEKRQRLKKALAMVATGAGASMGASVLHSAAGFDPLHIKTGVAEQGNLHMETKVTIPESSPNVEIADVKVNLSSHGFVQSIEDLKSKLVEQYGGVDKIPHDIKANIIDQPSIKLAQKLGFYDAKHNLSGVGFKGESLEINHDGQLVYNDLHGGHAEILDTKTGTVEHHFKGEMKDYDLNKKPSTVIETEHQDINQKPAADTSHLPDNSPEDLNSAHAQEATYSNDTEVPQQNVAENIPQTEVTPVPDAAPEAPAPLPGLNASPLEYAAVKSSITFDGTEAAHVVDYGNTKIWMLNDTFQHGDKYKSLREAFAASMDNQKNYEMLGKTVLPIPFEGGRIQVVQGVYDNWDGKIATGKINFNPNEVKVLLNGKEIAKGILGDKSSKIEIYKNLKGGWLFADTVYERAFKKANAIIKTLQVNK